MIMKMNQLFDEIELQKLMGKAQQGDNDSLVKVYEIFKRYTWRLMRSAIDKTPAIKDRNIIDDLVAEIWIRIFERLDRYQPTKDASVISWVHKFAINCKRDLLRRQQVRASTISYDDGNNKTTGDLKEVIPDKDTKTPLENLIAREDDQTRTRARFFLFDVLDLLNPPERYLLQSFYYDRLSYEEMSRRLGASIESLWKAKERALKKALDIYKKKFKICEYPTEK